MTRRRAAGLLPLATLQGALFAAAPHGLSLAAPASASSRPLPTAAATHAPSASPAPAHAPTSSSAATHPAAAPTGHTPAPHSGAHPAAHTTTSHPAAPPLPPPAPPPKPALPLPFLPRVANVRVDVAREYVVLTEQVRLPRDEYKSGDLRLYVSFGPVAPLAFDARVQAERDLDETADDGSFATIEFAPRVPASARLLLGRPQKAGAIVHIKEGLVRRAEETGAAVLTLRSVLPAPPPDKSGRREVVARLGAPEGAPVTLSRVEVRSIAGARIETTSANLCGPAAETFPLKVTVAKEDGAKPQRGEISPSNAVRNENDDLCIFYQLAP